MSLDSVTKHIVVDVADYGLYNSIVTAKQGDSGTRFINVTVLNNGSPYSLDGIYPVFRGRKPDGTTVFNSCDVVNDEVVIELTQQILLVAGISSYELALYESQPDSIDDTETNTVASFPIILNVVPSTFDPIPMESTDEFQVLTEVMHNIPMLAQLDEYTEYVQETLERIGDHHVLCDVPEDALFTDTTYSLATTTTDGLLSHEDFTKIQSVTSGAEPNQNAFSMFQIPISDGSSTTTILISASSATDSITFEGSNINLVPNIGSKLLTFQVTGDNVKAALGYTPASIDPSTGKIPTSELPIVPGGSTVVASSINGNITVNDQEVQVYRYTEDTGLLNYISGEINTAINGALNNYY